MPAAETPGRTDSLPLVSFAVPDELKAWRTVNDGVMGGRSSGAPGLSGQHLVFAGVINTQGGGFSSVRRTLQPGALDGGQAILLDMKPDARRYRLIARTDARFGGRAVSYQAEIPVSLPGEWAVIRVPLDAFVPTVFGRVVPAAPLDPAQVDEIGLIIADGVDGAFTLQVRWIGVERGDGLAAD